MQVNRKIFDSIFPDNSGQQARLLVIAVMLLTSGLLIIVLKSNISNIFVLDEAGTRYYEVMHERYTTIMALIGAVFSLVGIAQLLFFYLRFGFKLQPKLQSDEAKYYLNQRSKINNEIRSLLDKVESIDDKLNYFENRLQEMTNQPQIHQAELSQDERRAIAELIQKKLIEEGISDVIEKVEARNIEKLKEAEATNRFREHNDKTSARLTTEIEELGRRGNVNLIIGGPVNDFV